MGDMEPTSTGRPASEPTRTNNTLKTAGAPSDRHFEQMILPNLGFRSSTGLIRYLRNRFKRGTVSS